MEFRWLLVLGIPALLWLLLVGACSSLAQLQLSYHPLSAKRQATFREANRKLALQQVGVPTGTTLTAVNDTSNEDDDDQVTGVTTNFRLSMPVSTPTVDAWRAAHPDGPTPSAELDAAFDTDVYAPAWQKLGEVEPRLTRLGFRPEGPPDNRPLQSRTVTLQRGGVTVWLGIEYPGGSVSVYRHG